MMSKKYCRARQATDTHSDHVISYSVSTATVVTRTRRTVSTLPVLFSGVNNEGITVEVPAAALADLQTTCLLDRRVAPDLVQKSTRIVMTRNSIALFT